LHENFALGRRGEEVSGTQGVVDDEAAGHTLGPNDERSDCLGP
jgi:hypothetical protein